MNGHDPFEQRLSRQPVRQIPDAWREKILSAAESASAFRNPSPAIGPSLLSVLRDQLSALLWPHPRAWAALGAAWVLIVTMNVLAHEGDPTDLARSGAVPINRIEAAIKQKEQMYAELGLVESKEADHPKSPLNRPRSQWRGDVANA